MKRAKMECCGHKKENHEGGHTKHIEHINVHNQKHEPHCHEMHSKHEHDHKHSCHDESHIKQYKNRFFIALILTIPLFLLSKTIQTWLGFSLDFVGRKALLFVFAFIIYFYAGWPFLKGMYDEIKIKKPSMMSLVGLAISTAFIYSIAALFLIQAKEFFWELASLIDVMLLGHWIEARAVMASGKALEEVTKLLPKKAHLIKGNNTIDVNINELKKGDIVLVKPAEKIPADGIVVSGNSLVNEAMITGEAKPLPKQKNNKVIGGSINIDGSLKVKVTGVGNESYIAQVTKLIEDASKSKTRIQDIADKSAGFLFYIAITSGLLAFLIWLFIKPFDFALERAIAAIVIACPHALGLAIPLVVSIATARTARAGILIRKRQVFEQLKNTRVVVFDKTGTLTKGELKVSDVIGNKDILKIAASIESNSEHIIAKAILDYAKRKNIKLAKVEKFKAYPGKGVYAIVNNKGYWIGGGNLIKEKKVNLKPYEHKIKEFENQGKTLVFVFDNAKELIGVIALEDEIRKESFHAVKELKKNGIRVYMLTGDTDEAAKQIARKLSIKYFAKVLPHEKVEILEKIKQEVRQNQGKVVMVGDGINDAAALLRADIGIAIGAGTDLAIESADIILVKNNPYDVVKAIKFSKSIHAKMIQNLWWASGYNIVAIPLAAGAAYSFGILLNPAIAALLMSLSTVIVSLNAQTLRRQLR